MNKKYPISVITPFYEVDLNLFEHTFKSVVDQDFGFENIEFIIVVHNSGKSYLDGVLKLAEGYENVKVLTLNDEHKTPSSPRNHGIRNSTGDYIVFLDADDSLYPYALSESYKVITEEKAEMCLFRFDSIIGENVIAAHQYSLFDQTNERIILYKGQYDQKKLIVGMNMVVHARIIDGNFIRDNNFYFDVDIPYSEDGIYNEYLIANAEKIVILPQLIGERYYQHDGSVMQTFKRGKDEIIQICESVVKIAEQGWKFGLYMDSYITTITTMTAIYILCSDVRYPVVKKASEIIKPVLELLKPLPVTKFDSEQIIKTYNTVINLTFNHPRLASFIKWIVRTLGIDLEKVIKGAVKA